MAESVELATILLTDLVGSTRLATSVGPVRADELREEHFGVLRQAIASCDGGEVKNTGDGLMVAFASASAAVKCAVAMQQLFERRYGQAEESLHVRIGLGAGESSIKDGDYFGMPSIQAARLCAQAPADGILISGLTMTLAGRCEGVRFASAGELKLKGFPEPMEAFSVLWAPLGEEASGAGGWPLPAVLRSMPPVSYVGRLAQRRVLEEALVLARDGARQVVLLCGEPGIGKTRLASYAAHRAHADGVAVSWGACSEELAVPYEPWIEVCSQLVEHAPAELLAAHVERHGGELVRLARNLTRRIPELPELQTSDPETERYLLFSAVVGLLGQVADSLPVCVVLDDLHWADGQSVALLKHVVRSVEQGALEVIATYRDSDLGKDHPLSAVLADLRSVAGVQRVALRGLDVDEVAQIMTAVAGHELEQDGLELASQIAEETDGNPFFVGEILRGLSESGALAFDEATGRWSVDRSAGVALPESVREVIERRVERLGDEALEVLRLAAVIGRVFDVELLESTLDADKTRLLDHLEAAVAASVLAESSERVGRFRFAHALINQTLYEGLGATRRARMHQRVAEALEELYGADPGGRLAELALHWRLAALSVNTAKAADYARRAGQRALDSLAPAEAVKLFADALELTGNVESAEHCEALIGLGEAQRQTGDAAYRETLLKASRLALEGADDKRLTAAVLANNRGRTSVYGQVDAERVELIEAALERVGAKNPVPRARLLSLLALELTYEPDAPRRRVLSDEALALARAANDPRALAQVLRDRAWCAWDPWDTEDRRRTTGELLGLSETVDDPVTRFWALSADSERAVCEGEMQRAMQRSEEARTLAEKLGQPTLQWAAAYHKASLLHNADPDEADRCAKAGLEFGTQSGEGDAIMLFAASQSLSWALRGEWEPRASTLEAAVAAFPTIPGFAAALTALQARRGDIETAAARLAAAHQRDFDCTHVDSSTSTMLAFWAETAIRVGDRVAVVRLDELLAQVTDRVVYSGSHCTGSIDAYRALLAWELGRDEDADAKWRAGIELNEQMGLPLADLFPLLLRGHQLASQGRTDEAAEIYRVAHTLAEGHNLGGMVEFVDAALAGRSAARA